MRTVPRLGQRCLDLFVVVVLLGGLFLTTAPVAAGAAFSAGRPLQEFLNPDGTLNLASAYRGSVDARGWQLASGPGEPPRFVPQAADDHWDSRFAGPGVGGQAYALAVDGSGNLYVGGCFVQAGGLNANRVARWNGTTWAALGSGLNNCVYALALDGSGNLYAGGSFTTAGGAPAAYIARWNGSAWFALDSGMNNFVQALALDSGGNLYAGGYFTTAGGVTVNYVARWNGSAWSALGVTGTDNYVWSLAVDGSNNLYAGGDFTTAGGTAINRIARWDGSAWSALGSGANGTVRALLVAGSDLYAGGAFSLMGGISATGVARWNGSAWSALGSGINGTVYGLALDGGGNLYAGGLFSMAGGIPANYIARWNGSAWSTLSSGMNSMVQAVAVTPNGDLYAGGGFTRAGNLYTGTVARWDGSAWHPLGNGVVGAVNALLIDGSGNVYLGGDFDYVGGLTVNHIVRWDGTTWSPLGTGMSNSVYALALDGGGNLYAGGLFTTAGGIPAAYIARWNGSAWSALGTGMNNTVNALAVDGSNNLYAGGWFSTAGGVTVNYIARWNDSAWSALGSGMSSAVFSLAPDAAGNLYAGGQFITASGVTVNYIARWNGSAWSALGTGTNGYVRALRMAGTDLYAGGSFSQASGVTVNYIARWNGSAWSALGTGMSSAVFSLAGDAAGNLYAGGQFITAGGVTVNYIARWNGSAWSALGSGLLNGTALAIAAEGSGGLYTGGSFTMAGGKASNYFAHWFNTAPTVNDDFYTTPEEVALSVPAPGVLGNDGDAESDALTAVVVTPPPTGSLVLNANGSFVYTPPVDYFGVLTYTYQAADGYGGLGVATVMITVTNVNDAPDAVDDSYATQEDVPLVVTGSGVLANDSDADGDVLTAMLVTPPAHGTLALDLAGSFVYTPSLDWYGSDSFIYAAWDGVLSDTAAVNLAVGPVNDAPVATDDVYTTTEDTVLLVAAPGVLANDLDVDGDALSVTMIMPPLSGTAVLDTDGSLAYTPTADWNGLDILAYIVSDGVLTDTAAVWIAVTPANDAPVAVGDAYQTAEDVPLAVAAPGVLANDTDADGDLLTAELVVSPSNGTLLLAADGSLLYTPTLNWSGVDTFVYAAADGNLTAEATVVITVTPVNDAPLGSDDIYSTPEDTPLAVAAPGVLGNDSDVEGDPLSAAPGTPPANGTVALNADGSFTYTPTAGYNGADTFTYVVSDGTLTDTALVVIDVGAVNDAPIAQDDAYTTDEDTVITVTAPGVLANDIDPEGDPLTAAPGALPAHGTLVLNADGSFVYTPEPQWSGADSFSYVVSDGALTATAVVQLTVNPVNDAPLAQGEAYTTTEGTPLVIGAPGVLGNDSDAEDDPLTAVLDTPPTNGTLVLDADGSFTYAPAAGFSGVVTFTYHANDGTDNSNVATVTITVEDVPGLRWHVFVPIVLHGHAR